MAKISELLITILIISTVMSLFFVMLTVGSVDYDSTFDTTKYPKLNASSDAIQNMTNDLKDDANNLESSDGIFDIVGSLFNQGYNSLKLTFTSVDIFTQIATESTNDMDSFGPAKNIVLGMILAIIGVLIFVGVIMSAIIKWSM